MGECHTIEKWETDVAMFDSPMAAHREAVKLLAFHAVRVERTAPCIWIVTAKHWDCTFRQTLCNDGGVR